jgi:hypothetical protein
MQNESRRRFISVDLSLALVCLALAGCSSAPVPPPTGPLARPANPAPLSNDQGFFGREIPIHPPAEFQIDQRVAGTIHEALANDPELARVSGNLSVTVSKGIVTLGGAVPTENVRRRIIDRAMLVPGVDRVRDLMSVKSR